MTDDEEKKLIYMNYRLLLILGYAMGFIFNDSKQYTDKEKEQYDWLNAAVQNVVYLDKPLPPMP
jgi:hypothetical protein